MGPDLNIQNLRGNLDTRLRKLREGFMTLLSGSRRLASYGMARLHFLLSRPADFLPAIGQGALESKYEATIRKCATSLPPCTTRHAVAVEAERSFLEKLEGGCQVPIGGYAKVTGSNVELSGLVASLDGVKCSEVRERPS